jgi:hypothetical protein
LNACGCKAAAGISNGQISATTPGLISMSAAMAASGVIHSSERKKAEVRGQHDVEAFIRGTMKQDSWQANDMYVS